MQIGLVIMSDWELFFFLKATTGMVLVLNFNNKTKYLDILVSAVIYKYSEYIPQPFKIV